MTKKANVNICKDCEYAKYVKLTNRALMVKTKDITNILMEEIFCIYFAKKSTKKNGSLYDIPLNILPNKKTKGFWC